MSHFLADAIRAHVDNGAFLTDSDRAVLAVVEHCDLIEGSSERVGAAFARDFLVRIARELNVAIPIEHADEARRLLGNWKDHP